MCVCVCVCVFLVQLKDPLVLNGDWKLSKPIRMHAESYYTTDGRKEIIVFTSLSTA